MNPFREFRATDITAHSLQDEMGSRGYLLIRGLLPTEELNRLLGEIAQIVFTAGWLLPDHNPVERMANVSAACGDPDPLFKRTYEQIFSLESLHAFAHHAALRRVMNILVGPHLLIHPKPIVRLMFPHSDQFVVHAHQDHQAIAGDPESFTPPGCHCTTVRQNLDHCKF